MSYNIEQDSEDDNNYTAYNPPKQTRLFDSSMDTSKPFKIHAPRDSAQAAGLKAVPSVGGKSIDEAMNENIENLQRLKIKLSTLVIQYSNYMQQQYLPKLEELSQVDES